MQCCSLTSLWSKKMLSLTNTITKKACCKSHCLFQCFPGVLHKIKFLNNAEYYSQRFLYISSKCTSFSKVKLKVSFGDREKVEHNFQNAPNQLPKKQPISKTLMTIPNILTISRVLLTPPLGWCVLEGSFMLALCFFIYAGLTDLLDGWIARSFKSQISTLGSIIDPLADKFLVSTLFISLTYVNLIPISLMLLVLSRDVALTVGGFYLRYHSLPVHQRSLKEILDVRNETLKLQPTTISKVNTAVQLSLVAATLGCAAFNHSDHHYLHLLWWLTALTTVSSGITYIFAKDVVKIISKPQK